MSKFETFIRQCVPWIFTIAVFLWFGSSVHGQASSAALSVTVADTTGALITKAAVSLHNLDTNQEQNAASGNTGAATFSFLKPGRYRVMVEKESFADVVVDNITLNVGDQRDLRLTLKAGSAAETVTVDGSGLTINTTDASVSTVIDRRFVETTPLNGRSFQDLISLTPGVVTQSPQAGSAVGSNGDFSVNGQRTESNYYSVDGIGSNTNPGNGTGFPGSGTGGTLPGATALGTTQALLSTDALREFRAESSTYSAEFGRSPGGQFSMVTRSGTNDLHGTVFDYLRNNFFDANDWFNDHYGLPISALRQNDFGGTIGAPIFLPHLYDGRNRTFFFASYEGLRLTQPVGASIQYVPDTFMREQALPAMQPILNAFPQPNGQDYGSEATPNLAQFILGYSLPSSINSTAVRIDQSFGPKLSVFFRFSDTPSTAESRTLSMVSALKATSKTYTAGADSSITSKLTNTFRFGFSSTSSSQIGTTDSFGGAEVSNLAADMGVSGYEHAEPAVIMSFPSVGTSDILTDNTSNDEQQWNIVDAANASLGRHQVKFGVDYLRIKSPLSPYLPQVEAEYLSPGTVIKNQADYVFITNTLAATPLFNQFAAFAQDDWKLNRSLSISIGLRWELAPPPTGADGRDAYTLLGNLAEPSTLVLAPRGTPLWKTTWLNFAPRLGMAWQVHTTPGRETVLRTGAGVFYNSGNQEATGGFAGSSVGFGQTEYAVSAPLPVAANQISFTPSTEPPYTSLSVYAFPTHLQLPYTLEWNVSLEQALGANQSVTLAYVAANGRRLQQQQTLQLTKLNPLFGSAYYFPSGVTSNYQALQVKFQRQLSHGLQTLASYTWSHSLDYGSTSTETAITRGNSDFDVRNSFSGGLSWDIPTFTENGVLKVLTNRWGVDARALARSSFPITVSGSNLTDPVTGLVYPGAANLIPDRPLYLYGSQYPGGRALNGGRSATSPAFVAATGTSPGNAPRNFVRGFDATQINVAVRRSFPLRERLSLQFRAEAFNVLNHPNFGYVDSRLTDATFGQVTKMLNQSLGTLASQYQQGGSRSLQFALKLVY